MVDRVTFEQILQNISDRLTVHARVGDSPANSAELEERVRRLLEEELAAHGEMLALELEAQSFPDIAIREFGIEIKFTEKDSWVSVANSIHESHRTDNVDHIYVIFGKMGGQPEVRWGLYEDVVYHARTSHRPRFQIDMRGERQSIFNRLGVRYVDFAALTYKEKMVHMRTYARSRRTANIDFWWIEDDLVPYVDLSEEEKRKFKAQAFLLLPQLITQAPQALVDAAMYLASGQRILAHQMDTVFSTDRLNDLSGLEDELLTASEELTDGLFLEYWGQTVPREERLREWIRLLDEHAPPGMPAPSSVLFGGGYH